MKYYSDDDFFEKFLEDEDTFSDFEKNVKIFETVVKTRKAIFHVDEEIYSPIFYRSMCSILSQLKEGDEARFILNTPGGNLDTFIQLYSSMLETKATTIAEVYSAYSAGSLIALTCDVLEPKPFSSMMVHSLSAGVFGKAHEMSAQTNFLEKTNKKILKDIYAGFLTDSEISLIERGDDLWIFEDDIKKRLKKWIPIRRRNKK